MIFYFVSYKLAFASLFCGRCALMYLLVLFSGKMRLVKAPLRKKNKGGLRHGSLKSSKPILNG